MRCFFCKSPANLLWYNAGSKGVLCARCGDYKLTSLAEDFIDSAQFTSGQIANISGHIRQNPSLTISQKDLAFLKSLRSPTVPEKAMRALLALADLQPEPGTVIIMTHYGLEDELLRFAAKESDGLAPSLEDVQDRYLGALNMGCCSAMSEQELGFLLDRYLLEEGWTTTRGPGCFEISPRGWEVIAENTRGDVESNKGFVAMSFDPSLGELYQSGLYPRIRAAGYDPVRMDRLEHNNRIDDEIIVRIKGCKFLIADFSLDRGGIYFEAGFAMGLGRPVIWTVRHDALDAMHFDTRQYNFVRWWPDKLSELAGNLQNRIEATIGKGPIVE